MELRNIVPIILFLSQIHSSLADSDALDLHVCMKNKTISIQVSTEQNDDKRCKCQCSPFIDQNVRYDYVHTPGVGSHKLHVVGKTWNEARKICNQENSHLAIINSQAEAEVLMNILKAEAHKIQGTHKKEQAFLGIHDMFKEGEWLTVFGEPLESTGFTGWSRENDCYRFQPDNFNGDQDCGTILSKCDKMDDAECHAPHAFFCELPISCI